VKVSLRIFRFSRKVVYIITGTLLLSGAAGATALYIGRDKLLGPSGEALNGLDCTLVQTTTIHKKDRFWIRKYIKTESADGLTRVKTALRVAGAVFEKEQPDLVQVVVLDEKGPEKRADIRGRVVGADVIFVPKPQRLAATEGMPQFTVTYTDAPAGPNGTFFGQKTVMEEEDIHRLVTALSDKSDCFDPTAPVLPDGVVIESKGAKKEKGGEAAKSEGGGHGAKPEGEAEGEKAAEGEAVGEGEKPAEGEEAKADESKGWIASVKAMVLGEDKPAQGEEAPAEAEKGDAATDEKAGAETAPHG
jgi:hypothetical protein